MGWKNHPKINFYILIKIMIKNYKISQKELKDLLKYNQETGVFHWIKNNKIAGTSRKVGYIGIVINKNQYLAHRLAWLYVYGEYPKNCIDHINGIKFDNRIINLRDVSHKENCNNRSKYNADKFINNLDKNEIPMGVSQWRQYGEKYGYWKYFEEILLEKIKKNI